MYDMYSFYRGNLKSFTGKSIFETVLGWLSR